MAPASPPQWRCLHGIMSNKGFAAALLDGWTCGNPQL